MIKIKPLVSAVALAAYGAGAMGQGVLEEVIVTAQKRAQSIQDVPLSITAFSGDFLEEKGIQTIAGVAKITPNFNIAGSSQAANNRIQIRGMGAAGNNAIESSVGVFIDGVYYPRPGSVIGLLMDINSFEVLRGPQGTLFGRNTVAGAMNITTRNPSQETEGTIEAGFGDYDLYEVGGSFSGALSDSVTGRLAFKYADRDGYYDNTYDGEEFGARDDLMIRGKLLFDLSDQLSVLVTADYAEINAENLGPEVLNSTSTPAFEAATTALYGSSPVTKDSYDWKIHHSQEHEYEDEQQGLAVDINYEFSNGLTLRSITAVREWEAIDTNSDVMLAAEMVPGTTDYDNKTLSQEFHLMSPGGETVDWMAGLYYYEEDYDIDLARDTGEAFCVPTIAAVAGPAFGAFCLSGVQEDATTNTFTQELESIAVFGQATWNINDAWNTTVGLRWTDDEKEGDYTSVLNNPATFLFAAEEEVLGMERDDSKTTWFGNVNWHVTDDIMLFATASTGYKSGGFNSQSGGRTPLGEERRIFAPEETTNYELGVKSTLLDGTMTANATLFRMDVDDFQDRAFDGLSFIVLNAGEVRQQGVEADINWAPIDPLRIVAGVGYLDSEYLEFEGAPGLPGGEPQDLKGESRTFSPEWQTSLSADWTQSFANGMEWFVGGSWSWVDEQNVGTSSNNNPQSHQDSYSIVDARLGLRSASGNWDVTLYGNNLTEEDFCQSIFDQGFGAPVGAIDPVNNTSVQRCALGAPTTWAVRGSYRF
ncbi:MAG: TonB-dependent receptor [Halieaceae bacterium]